MGSVVNVYCVKTVDPHQGTSAKTVAATLVSFDRNIVERCGRDSLKVKMKNQGFTRREFLRLGLATGAAAYGGGLLGLPGCGSSGASGGAPTDYYQLNVGYSERVLGGYRVR